MSIAKSDRKELFTKWGDVLDHKNAPEIKDAYKKFTVAQILENTEAENITAIKNGQGFSLLNEAAPTNNISGGNIKYVDPVLIALLRRSMPNLIGYEVCGVQPMNAPTGLIFAFRSRYQNQTGPEAFYNEANTSFSGSNAGGNTANLVQHVGTSPALANSTNYTSGGGMSTALGEALGDAAANQWAEMSFSIDKVTANVVTRALKAEYSMEIAQDLRAYHGLDAEQELATILSVEILAEINREIVRKINWTATDGAPNTATAGVFDLDVDANGRWSVEKYKGLMMQIELEANQIAKQTRRGRGNIIICSSNVASALAMAGILDYTPALNGNDNIVVDDTGNTFAGILNGRYKVFIDPYFAPATAGAGAGMEYVTIGYKGANPYDAGLFYSPYVPLQMVRAIDSGTFNPKIGFKTRYALTANPFATAAGDGVVSFSNKNLYYNRIGVKNIL